MACSYCGKDGHNRATCPKRQADEAAHLGPPPTTSSGGEPAHPASYTPALWEKIIVAIVAVAILILVGWLVVRNQPFADPNLVVVLRIIVSLAVAALGATVPGFLQIGWDRKGIILRAGGALALFVLTYLLTPKVVAQAPPEHQNSILTTPTSLLLRMEKSGEMNAAPDYSSQGALFEFTLSNATHGLAIIDDIAVEVLDVMEDKWPVYGATVSTYKYRAVLKPETRGLVSVAKGFKYSAGETDRFSLNVSSSKDGFDYFVRIVMKWYDGVTKETRETHSDVMVARLPSLALGDKLTPNERGAGYEKQSKLIEERLRSIRARLSQ
jgi:hypothetical protein